ncbi:MAG TPA: redoxin domain-containing protein [Pirellulales bacterium]|nr:redoxin domain-containing protein [Pirellulales bacterium]
MISHQHLVRRSAWIAAAVISCYLSFPFGFPCDAPLWAADEPEAKFEEGWRRSVPLSEPDKNGGTEECIAWVQDGWLQVKRQTAEGETEWQVVLARSADAVAPEIEFMGAARVARLVVRFREGRYFIRNTSAIRSPRPRPDIPANLVCYREYKTPGGDWPHVPLPEPDGPGRSMSFSPNRLRTCCLWSISSRPWLVTATGPAVDEPDCLVRLDHFELAYGPNGSVSQNMLVANVTRGESNELNVRDDGELLIANYIDDPTARRLVGRPPERANQIGVETPELSCEKWFNTDHPLTLNALRGKVVLVVFFNSSDARSIGAFRDLDELSAKYREQGLVVLGVDSPHGAPDKAVSDHGLKLPFVVDDGETAKRYDVKAMPLYFSIRRDGTLTFVHKAGPPPPRQIERLLERDD